MVGRCIAGKCYTWKSKFSSLASGYPIVCLYYSHSRLILHKRARVLSRAPLSSSVGSVPRWTLADLNPVKEGSDLKKERAGRKPSFSLGLLTSGNLSPVDWVVSRGHVASAADLRRSLRSSSMIVRLLHFFFYGLSAAGRWAVRDLGISTYVKNLNRSGGEFSPAIGTFYWRCDFSFRHARRMSRPLKTGDAPPTCCFCEFSFFHHRVIFLWQAHRHRERGITKFRWYELAWEWQK